MALSDCMRKAGNTLNAEDASAIVARSRELQAQGLSKQDAETQSVQERMMVVSAMLSNAQGKGGAPGDNSAMPTDASQPAAVT